MTATTRACQVARLVLPGQLAAVPEYRDADYAPTDLGNAELLVHLNVGRLRYVASWREWIVCTAGGRWQLDTADQIIEAAKGVTIARLAAASDEASRAHALKSQSLTRLRAIVTLARSDAAMQLDIDAAVPPITRAAFTRRGYVKQADSYLSDYVNHLLGWVVGDGLLDEPDLAEQLADIALKHNAEVCRPPLDDAEVRRILADALQPYRIELAT